MKTRKHKKRVRRVTKKRTHFFFHPHQPNKSFNVYVDKNPKNTIPIRYKTVNDVQETIQRLERLYHSKTYPHQRIWQVAMIMKVRLEVLRHTKPKQYALAKRYFEFLGKRTTLSENERYRFHFSILG